MKVISHFCFTLDPSRGGVSSGLLETAIQLRKHGIQAQIISFGNTRAQIKKISQQLSNLQRLGIDYLFTLSRIKNDYGFCSLYDCFKILKMPLKSDLIVLHQIYTLSTLIGYICAKKQKVPYAVMPHGSLTKYHESDSKVIKGIAKRFIVSKILSQASAIIVTCENEKSDLVLELQDKAIRIGYGIVPAYGQKKKREDSENTTDKIHIFFSGRFDKKKNLPLTIKAIPFLTTIYPNLVLDIAGWGTPSEVRDIQKLIASLDVGANVEMHGWLDKPKLRSIQRQARLLVLPSENENFAIVVAEALGAGIPCVVSSKVGTSDIVSRYSAGEVIIEINPASIANAINKVLRGDQNKYREAAFDAVRFSLNWSIIAQTWTDTINSIAAKR